MFLRQKNKETKQVIKHITDLVENAKTNQDLYKAVEVAIEHGKPLIYDYNWFESITINTWWFLKYVCPVLLIAYIIGCGTLLLIPVDGFDIAEAIYFSTFLSFIAILLFLEKLKYNYSKFKKPHDYLFLDILVKDKLLDHGIDITPSQNKSASKNMKKAILFKEGDWKLRKLLDEYDGKNIYGDLKSPFTYYHIVYGIDLGKVEGFFHTQKVGFIFPSNYKKRLLILYKSDYRITHKSFLRDPYRGLRPATNPLSYGFNQQYTIMSPNGEDVSDLFSPRLMDLFNDPRMKFEFDLEILPSGELIFQFHDDSTMLDFGKSISQFYKVSGEYVSLEPSKLLERFQLHDKELLDCLKTQYKNSKFVTALEFMDSFQKIINDTLIYNR